QGGQHPVARGGFVGEEFGGEAPALFLDGTGEHQHLPPRVDQGSPNVRDVHAGEAHHPPPGQPWLPARRKRQRPLGDAAQLPVPRHDPLWLRVAVVRISRRNRTVTYYLCWPRKNDRGRPARMSGGAAVGVGQGWLVRWSWSSPWRN